MFRIVSILVIGILATPVLIHSSGEPAILLDILLLLQMLALFFWVHIKKVYLYVILFALFTVANLFSRLAYEQVFWEYLPTAGQSLSYPNIPMIHRSSQ